MLDNGSIKGRLLVYCSHTGIPVSRFEKEAGLSNGYFNQVKKQPSLDKLDSIHRAFPDLNIDWLVYGAGNMLNNNSTPVAKPAAEPQTGIPLIPISAMAGFGTGDMQVLEYECERFVIPTFHEAEFLIQVKGSSMYPKYSSGDIVACKKLPVDTFFQWNKVYVLDTVQGALIKRIKRANSEDNLLIVSDNPKYEPFELKRSEIRSVAIVIGVIRLE